MGDKIKWPMEKFSQLLSEAPRNGISPSGVGAIRAKVLTLSAITGDRFDETAFKVSTFKSMPTAARTVDRRDFLICRGNGNIGLVGRGLFPTCTMSDTIFPDTIIAVRPSARVDPRYLQLAWNGPYVRQQIQRIARTTNGTYKISQEMLDSITLPVPSIQEQRRIAEILEQADELRAKRRQAIALLDDLAESVFLEMFGKGDIGSSCRLGEVAEIVSGVTKGRRIPDGVKVQKVPYLAVANVQAKRLDLSTLKTIDASAAEIERYRLCKNDLLLTEGGDPDKLGRGTLWNNELPEAIHQNHIFRVRLRNDMDIDPIYLSWYVGSKHGRRYFLRSAKQTTGIASINATQLRNFPLHVPSRHMQDLFAARIASVRGARDLHLAHLSELDELFGSLQQRAFRGEL